jgi:hypothetical protein
MTLPIRKFHVAVLTLILVVYGCWSLSSGVSGHHRDSAFCGLAALAAAAGVVGSQRWSAWVVYLIALLIMGEWLWYLWLIFRLGYFAHIGFEQVAVSAAPGVAVVAIAGYCCFVAWRYVRTT